MPKYICETKNQFEGSLYEVGAVLERDRLPNKHWGEIISGQQLEVLEPKNAMEKAVYDMRPVECVRYIKEHFGRDLNPRDLDLSQKALRIVRDGVFKPAQIVETREDVKNAQARETKKQMISRIESENHGVDIPAVAKRSIASLTEFEKSLKKDTTGEEGGD